LTKKVKGVQSIYTVSTEIDNIEKNRHDIRQGGSRIE